MYKCKECDKEFNNQSSLNAHQIAHKEKVSRYTVSRKKTPAIYQCLFCGKENGYGHSKKNKFCDNVCQGKYSWEYITKPKVLRNECNAYSHAPKQYLIEIHGEKCFECGQSNVWNNKPLTIQLDHIDGNSDNNHLSNLRLLCPNCHTQSDTFGSKGQGNRYKKVTKRNTYLQEYKRKNA